MIDKETKYVLHKGPNNTSVLVSYHFLQVLCVLYVYTQHSYWYCFSCVFIFLLSWLDAWSRSGGAVKTMKKNQLAVNDQGAEG